MFSIRLDGSGSDAVVELMPGVRREGPVPTYMSPLSTEPCGPWNLSTFHRLVEAAKQACLKGRLELVELDGIVHLRVTRLTGPRSYRLIPLDLADKRILGFLKRQALTRTPTACLSDASYNIVSGRNSEKLLHEWLSHPAEEGHSRPGDVSLSGVLPAWDSPPYERLVRGVVTPPVVPLPKQWLLIRTVTDGWFDKASRRVHLAVSEAFLRRGDLIQSVHPFRFSATLDDLDRRYAGGLSRRPITGGGYYCSKFGEQVFGRITSPALLFQDVPVTVEE